ncbi:MAG: hypothetical protein ACJAZH_001653 [Roseivirga sp.]|jgi:hypothetical protein
MLEGHSELFKTQNDSYMTNACGFSLLNPLAIKVIETEEASTLKQLLF